MIFSVCLFLVSLNLFHSRLRNGKSDREREREDEFKKKIHYFLVSLIFMVDLFFISGFFCRKRGSRDWRKRQERESEKKER